VQTALEIHADQVEFLRLHLVNEGFEFVAPGIVPLP
jgi:hypothetical protein